VLIGGWVAFTVMRVFGLEGTWYLNTFVAFTPYVTLLSAVPLIFALLLRRWRAVTVALLTSLALITLFLPRAIGSPDPGHGPTLRVMSSNMKIGAADPNAIVALVRAHHIDLLAVEEFTPDAEDRLAAAGLTTLLPFTATTPIDGATGSAIYSRYPITETGYMPLAGGFGQEYATVSVPGAKPLLFDAVHTRAPNLPSSNTDWARSIAQQPPATPKGAVRLLAGDFNATLDHSRLRTLLDTGYVDIASQLGDGLTATWPYDGRWIPPITLDHFFADPRIGAVSFGATVVRGTDHKAIYAVITLPSA
jgi:endonuclease/exonuclease/phosphatase (EEP) superfamily protein YafD